ncbi:NAD-dependent deacetylase [Niveibacterium sp. 24ML]|uniref:SIR2 family NAD-dependent protein deacylase n=1 Tax=Niveibacterium sp. 24ML TaxID=2985512 RepID=UPI00226D6388|nr:Sir2 family NAD-dependent protein deacetylase [Niveibacterium sp. 24ML]MCX9157911.1 NAD-dependent deacetylase [Niveibacterium sp. 24ML]
MSTDLLQNLMRAAQWIKQADALLITAGAGMGVDSGLPDFRGPEGFWKAYPALGRRKLHFADIADPAHFRTDPTLAWGFYGHRLALYRETIPHKGFALLLEIGAALPLPTFVVTSNVDGQFQKAGFSANQIWEIHGSIHHLQCVDGCAARVWPADDFPPQVDMVECALRNAPPRCLDCGAIARPNILMFSDWAWLNHRSRMQEARFEQWLAQSERIVTIELGAGTAISSIRRIGEKMLGPLIRINKRESRVARAHDVEIPLGALDAMTEIHACLKQLTG